MRVRITEVLARAAGWDAGNENAKANGRKVWNEEDYNVAASTYNRLYTQENEKAV